MSNKECERVVNQIKAAFADTEYPGDENIFVYTGGYYFDIEEAVKLLSKKHWSEIPLEALIRNRDRMSWLTKEAFHFFLPAFLIAAIEHAKIVDVLTDNIIFSLIPPNENVSWSEIFFNRAVMLNPQQIEAILSFFRAYKQIYPPSEWSYLADDDRKIRRAINFWEQRLSELF